MCRTDRCTLPLMTKVMLSPELYVKCVIPPQTAQVELLHDVHTAYFADVQEKYLIFLLAICS